jgi:hypothetical protein
MGCYQPQLDLPWFSFRDCIVSRLSTPFNSLHDCFSIIYLYAFIYGRPKYWSRMENLLSEYVRDLLMVIKNDRCHSDLMKNDRCHSELASRKPSHHARCLSYSETGRDMIIYKEEIT